MRLGFVSFLSLSSFFPALKKEGMLFIVSFRRSSRRRYRRISRAADDWEAEGSPTPIQGINEKKYSRNTLPTHLEIPRHVSEDDARLLSQVQPRLTIPFVESFHLEEGLGEILLVYLQRNVVIVRNSFYFLYQNETLPLSGR